jgi:sugar phosphate isomerase/epimerase
MVEQKLIYHGLVSRQSTLAMDMEVMRQTGFDGLEISPASKLQDVLDAGFSEADLTRLLKGIDVPGVGFLLDIERHGSDRAALMRDAERLFHLAVVAGARAVEVITGPVDVRAVEAFAAGRMSDLYKGVLGLPRDEQIAITSANLADLADLAAGFGLTLYLECLAWSPLNRLDDQVELLDRADRDNLRLLVDYWHCYASGDTPERVSRLDGDLIYGVHFCDSLEHVGGIPNEAILRDVPTGQGVLDLGEWTDAVLATGYVGWWSCELFCRRQHQSNSFAVAGDLYALMDATIRRG